MAMMAMSDDVDTDSGIEEPASQKMASSGSETDQSGSSTEDGSPAAAKLASEPKTQPAAQPKIESAQALASANSYTDAQVGAVSQRLDRFESAVNDRFNRMDKSLNAGVASALAIGNLPQPTESGRNMLSLGTASHNGQQALAIGLSSVTPDGKYVIKGAFSTNTDSDASGAVSVGFQW